jgi:hypothetical protein
VSPSSASTAARVMLSSGVLGFIAAARSPASLAPALSASTHRTVLPAVILAVW